MKLRSILPLLWLVLAAATVFLGVQAGKSLMAAFSTRIDSTADDEDEASQAGRKAARALGRAKSCRSFTGKLAETDLLHRPPDADVPLRIDWQQGDDAAGAPDPEHAADEQREEEAFRQSMNQASGNWGKSEAARKLAARYAPLAKDVLPGERANSKTLAGLSDDELAAQREALESFQQDYDRSFKNRVEQGAVLVERVKGQLTHVNKEKQRRQDLADADRELAEARELFANAGTDPARYEQCLEKLNDNPLNRAASPKMSAEVETLRGRCQYRLVYLDLWGKHKERRDDQAELDDFLDRYDSLPRTWTSERKTYATARKWLNDLKTKLALAEFIELLQTLDEPGEFESVLGRLVAVYTNPLADAGTKASARDAFRTWLFEQGLPHREPPPMLLGLREATTRAGRRLIGDFYLPPAADSWRYWKAKRTNASKSRGDLEPIPKKEFVEVPDTPKYVQWAAAYNEARDALAEGGETREAWQAFSLECAAWQEALESYQQTHGIDDHQADAFCKDWPRDFGKYAALSGKIEDRWEQVGVLLDNK